MVTAEQKAGVGMKRSTISVGHRQIFVSEAGDGEAVVLLHGGGAGASGLSNFARNIHALSQHFRVIVPDMPGYGRSSKGIDQSDPFGDLALFVRGLLDSLEIETAHLIGNSYGGAAALRCALDRPERVDRLVLLGPGGIGTTRSLPTRGLMKLTNYYAGEGPTREKLDEFIRDYLVYDGAGVPSDLIEERFQASLDPEVMKNPPLQRPSGMGALRKLRKMDLLLHGRLKTLETPTLVLWGEADKVNRPSGGLTLARTMPECDLYLVSRTGHWVQWEQPDIFNRTTINFLTANAKIQGAAR
ncbi:alpha/beta fold hydrolase [Kocuria sp.]|uniref:alpha/beta fold hydrolase n=1 Tax=Kocuria sp. TaxID=1871328 RepID=UPI0026E08507|nr:alpha/beta hydrolase [Kocuria sp.]MDO5619485.1 alpha/beta hydrolase [Kocuria sp.]